MDLRIIGNISSITADGVTLYPPGTTTPLPPDPTGPTGPTGPSGPTGPTGPTTPPGTPKYPVTNVTWPVSGQTRPTLELPTTVRIKVPYGMAPHNVNNTGFLRITEVPGTPVSGRQLEVNGIVYPVDSSPGAIFTLGNPNFAAVGAQFNVNPGDTIEANISNVGPGGPVLMDFASPTRY